jgi:hypothetical protein
MYAQSEEVTRKLWDLQRKLLGESNSATLDTMEQLELLYLEDGKSEQSRGQSAQAKVKLARAEELAIQHLEIYLAKSRREDARSYTIRDAFGPDLRKPGTVQKGGGGVSYSNKDSLARRWQGPAQTRAVRHHAYRLGPRSSREICGGRNHS